MTVSTGKTDIQSDYYKNPDIIYCLWNRCHGVSGSLQLFSDKHLSWLTYHICIKQSENNSTIWTTIKMLFYLIFSHGKNTYKRITSSSIYPYNKGCKKLYNLPMGIKDSLNYCNIFILVIGTDHLCSMVMHILLL